MTDLRSKMVRRALLAALVNAPIAMAFAQGKQASGPVNLIIPFAPGGITDGLGRLLGSKLSAKWHTSVVIQNKPGGGTSIATRETALAPGDGKTLLLTAVPFVTNPLLLQEIPYDPSAIEPLILAGISTSVLYVHPSLPVKTVDELIQYAKANPDKVSFASSGNGTVPHLAAELFAARTGTQTLHVPFRGTGPAMINVLGGQVSGIFDTMQAWPYVASGKLRPIAVANMNRLELAPDVPTFHESGLPEFTAYSWFGFVIPAVTPKERQGSLFKDIRAVLDDSEVVSRFPQFGMEVVADVRTQDDFKQFLRGETKKWSYLIRERKLSL